MIDAQLTLKMQEWLDSESHNRESILRGAEMLLKLNRNTVRSKQSRALSKLKSILGGGK